MSADRLTKCAVCHRDLEKDAEHDFDRGVYLYTCGCCGRFKCTQESDDVLPRLSRADRVRLSGIMRERSDQAMRDRSVEFPLIRSDNVTAYLAGAPGQFDVATKVRKVLSAVARHTAQPGQWNDFADETSHPLAFAADLDEWEYLTDYATGLGWLDKERQGREDCIQLRLTPAGWEDVQRRPRIESAQGFVATWFDPSMDDAYENGIKASFELDCGYRARRIDFKEFNEDIVFEIMAEIRESRFVVADLTNQNNGVYFEAGFARGLDIPVIWTCRSDDTDNIHFDASHDKQIRWETPADLRTALTARIKGTIGVGPLKPLAD